MNCKVVLVGEAGVGKTSLTYWFLNNKYLTQPSSTIGASFTTKSININKKNIKFSIWDTAGQERFRSIVKLYYRDAVVCICIFDVTNRNSYNCLDYWIKNYKEYNNFNDNNYIILVIANKCDIDKSKWMVTEKEINKFVSENKYEFFYTNCITGENINEAFEKIGQLILEKKIKSDSDIRYFNQYFTKIPDKKQCDC